MGEAGSSGVFLNLWAVACSPGSSGACHSQGGSNPLGSTQFPGALIGEAIMYSGDSQEFQLPNLVIQVSPQPQPHVLLPCLGYLPAAGLMTLS